MSENGVDTVDCAKVLEEYLLWTLGCVFVFFNIVGSCHLNFSNFLYKLLNDKMVVNLLWVVNEYSA